MRWVIAAVLLFGLGGCYGASTQSDHKVDIVTITKTKLVEAEPEPAPPAEIIMPQSCKEALRHGQSLFASSNKMYNSGQAQIDILREGQIALTENGNLVSVETHQRELSRHLIGYLSKMSEDEYRFEEAYKTCLKEAP